MKFGEQVADFFLNKYYIYIYIDRENIYKYTVKQN